MPAMMTPENDGLPTDVATSTNMVPPRLQVSGICSSVVAPISFDLPVGQCLSVSGPSGAGKTRLLRLLADLDEGGGEVYLDGVPRSAYPAPDWRTRVLYQGAESAWWLPSVIEHLAADERDEAVRLAARLALGADRLTAHISQLSTGERQRATLVRSLLRKPAVLLLDEPSSALDAENVGRMEDVLLERLRGGMSLLLVTHSKEQAGRLSTGTIQVRKR